MRPIQNSELLDAVAEALYERLAGGPELEDDEKLRARIRSWVDDCEDRGGELWEAELGPLLERLERRMLAAWAGSVGT